MGKKRQQHGLWCSYGMLQWSRDFWTFRLFYSQSTRTSNRQNVIDLYRDDGLGIFHGISKPVIERKKKLIFKTFRQCRLAITTECNLKTVNFLDIAFDVQNNVYKPYCKPKDKPTYINKNSNHPPGILKYITLAIRKNFDSLKFVVDNCEFNNTWTEKICSS